MTLKAQMQADLDIFFETDEFAQLVDYQPKNGPLKQIKAIFDSLNNLDEEDYGKSVFADIEIRQDDIPNPAYQDTITINGVIWTVTRIVDGDGYTWQLELRRDIRGHLDIGTRIRYVIKD